MESSNVNWLAEHGLELFSKYAGKWIAVHDGNIVGVGDTAPEAAAEARKKVGDEKFILEALDVSGDVIYAGF